MTSVAVIIAAKNASATIAEAVRSALAEPQVRRVVLVDDGSSDNTTAAAQSVDDGTGRLRSIRFETNRGPAAARNAAFSTVEEDFVAVLDADDRFLPGRVGRLLAAGPVDMVADNIVFVKETSALSNDPSRLADLLRDLDERSGEMFDLTLAAFVNGNITRVGAPRAELGFLKPMIRTALLRSLDGPWNVSMRLGEDYDLYARLLLAGATFRIVGRCGYFALERASSLSGDHSVIDLQRFADADRQIIERRDLDPPARQAARLHQRQCRARFEHRRFLDEKASHGLIRAGASLLARPHAWGPVTIGIGRDKLRALAPAPAETWEYRLLLDPRPPIHATAAANARSRPAPFQQET